MKRYKVTWNERHETIVRANDEDDAFDNAKLKDYEVTLKDTNIDELKMLGFECDECGEYWPGLEDCMKCRKADDMDVSHADREDKL